MILLSATGFLLASGVAHAIKVKAKKQLDTGINIHDAFFNQFTTNIIEKLSLVIAILLIIIKVMGIQI